jgi:hypothetical protein
MCSSEVDKMVKRRTLVVTILGSVLLLVVLSVNALGAASGGGREAGSPAQVGVASGTVPLGAIKDTTLYEESDSLSNGQGEYFFAGAIGGGDRRRGLVKFDIASNVPPPRYALIVSATLRLYVSKNPPPPYFNPEPISIHRVMADWGEGTSNAPDEEGTGTQATLGDATWAFSYYSPTPTDRISWTSPGSDFLPGASATSIVGEQDQYYTWTPTSEMLSDLRHWQTFPEKNFGWLLMGNEQDERTARRFNSSENSSPVTRPTLYVEYAPVLGRQFLPLMMTG